MKKLFTTFLIASVIGVLGVITPANAYQPTKKCSSQASNAAYKTLFYLNSTLGNQSYTKAKKQLAIAVKMSSGDAREYLLEAQRMLNKGPSRMRETFDAVYLIMDITGPNDRYVLVVQC